ncbi:hypothetical protein EW093_01115 [Thiospirochaeta perfilievii]|uniref:DUF2846 domain-containing protein n=1 Tax=Thiospirochaeta perfilievii TaxID=252967 RepID=A0A5C1Q7F4_9SPIO|nr:hypothetical protein [Thiospirochaeta perfilievii]QEN03361.1 hypothetical protein EW093_01115 [Thiospirochaeta perfilievii]
MKYLLIIVSILSLFSCTTVNYVRTDTVLEENKGILICSIHVDEPGWGINIFKRDALFASGIIKKIKNPWDIIMMTLEEGEYTYNTLYYPPRTLNLERKYFKIEAGKINYIGDLYLDTSGDPYLNPRVKSKYKDNKRLVLERLASEYPIIISKYKIVEEVLETNP